MRNRKTRMLGWGISSFLFIVMAGGCLKNVEPQPIEPKAFISIMHLASTAPAIEVYVNGEKASQPIFPGSYSSAYSGVTPGIFDISFKKASSDSLVASIAAASYDSAKFYTFLVYNSQPFNASAVRITDDFSTLSPNQASYRFFHLSADVPEVDLYIDNTKVETGREYADNVQSSIYNTFTSYAPGSHNLVVKKAGTDSVIIQTSTTLYQANAFTIFLNGLANAGGTSTLDLDVLQAAN